jgi:hypothetical protein
MLVDSNAVFRAACRALLLTEGLHVAADVAPSDEGSRSSPGSSPTWCWWKPPTAIGAGVDLARRL